MPGDRFFIGIGGGTCSGKTTLSANLKERVGEKVTVITQDRYYERQDELSKEERKAQNYDHPDAFDWDLKYEHLKKMIEGKPVQVPIYDFTTHNRSDETDLIEPKDSIILEGILALYDEELRDLMDLKIYMYADDDIRAFRRMDRDTKKRGRTFDEVKRQYFDTVKPMHEKYVEETRKFADREIPGNSYDKEYCEELNKLVEKIKDISS